MAADELLCQSADVVSAWPAFANLPAAEQLSLMNVASQKILNFCGRPFAEAFHNEYHDGKNNGRLWLLHRPVMTVQAITINDVPIDNTDGYAWTFNPKSGELVRGRGIGDSRFAQFFPSGKQNILVQYWAGYATVPDPVVRATVFYVKYLHERAKVIGIYSAERIGDYNYTLNAVSTTMTLPGHVVDLLAEYVQDDGPL